MADTYHKIGTSLRLYLYAMNRFTGAPLTGLTDGSFTKNITKNLTGNQATTGCTITEVDGTNNAGVYAVDCSGTTSFAAATGSYEFKVYRTSDSVSVWNGTVRVTSDGTGAGSWGDASFTATASDGRVMASAVPLDGATVRILDPSGVLYVQTTTDASGLWGPVYFNVSGTYTVYVQKANYTATSGTIVVSGSSATGPGADLTIALATSSSGLLASDLQAYARRMMTSNTGALADTLTLEAVNEAATMLAQVRQWPYLQARGTINTVAAYTTGTVTIANGGTSVTLSSGTWPTWAANGVLYVNGAWTTVTSRTSGTVLVIPAWGEAAVTAGTYTIARHSYDLPDDLMRVDQVLFGQNWPYGQCEVSAAKLETYRDMWQTGVGFPYVWAVRSDQFMVWPFPTDTHRVNLLYYKRPDYLVSGLDVLDWDPMHVTVLHRAIDYQVALRGECVAGTPAECKVALEEAIDLAYVWDKTGTDRELHTGSDSFDAPYDTLRGPITG